MTDQASVVTLEVGTSASVVSQLDALVDALRVGDHVVLIAEDLLVPPQALSPVNANPFAPTSVLVTADAYADVVVRHHTAISAGTSFFETTDPTHRSVGALVIAQQDFPAARAAIARLRSAIHGEEVVVTRSEIIEAVLVALVRHQIQVRAIEMVDVPWFRAPADRQSALRQVGEVSEQRIQGLLANRTDDGFYSTFVVRKASKPLTRLALRLGLSPNAITGISFVIGIAAAALFATGQWPWIVLGALALQLSLIVDCVDGEVARATRKFSSLGAWLDAATDRVKEFAAYAGLAIGAAKLGEDVWWVAITLILLQTTRHVSDYNFAAIQRLRETQVPAVDIRERSDGRVRASGGLAGAMQTSARINRRTAVRWSKKVIHMPIGERWLVLSVLAVVAGPAWALGGLLIAGVLALSYVLTGRIARTLTWSGVTPGDGAQILDDQMDAGPVASGIGRIFPALTLDLAQRFAWGLPVFLRGTELIAIALLVTVGQPGNLVVAFWIVFVIAYHHYDNLYRSLQGARPPRWLTWWGFGWEGRLLVIVPLALTAIWEPSLSVLLTWWALWFAGVASIQWLRSDR